MFREPKRVGDGGTVMIVKLENLSAEQIQVLGRFVKSTANKATVLHWESAEGGYWVETPSDRSLVEVMDGCRVNPDTGYFQVTLKVNETALDPRDLPVHRDGRCRVLLTNFFRFVTELNIFLTPPQFGDLGRARHNSVDANLTRLGEPLPIFARPKKAEPKSEPDEPTAAAPATEPSWEVIKMALIEMKGNSMFAAARLGVSLDVVQRAVSEHAGEPLILFPKEPPQS
jgi:hypothetical protein